MFECPDVTTALDGRLDDPRIDEEFLRCVPGTDRLAPVLLVGVVHDHPASVFRVSRILETIAPETLAVELPPLAVGLFRLYANDEYVPPRLGGEMSAAIRAAPPVPIKGIDAPNREYLRSLFESLSAERIPSDVVWTALWDLASSSAHAIACRLGALVGSITPLRLRLYTHIEYESSLLDSPAVQAAHESEHIAQRQAFLRAIRTPRSLRVIDAAREDGMATRLHDLRVDGSVVAVVGMEHLDGIHARLLNAA